MTPKLLRQQADMLFSKRGGYMSLLQEIAENFYPERADFTYRRELGNEWAGNMTSSYPTIIRRELGDSLGTMLRNTKTPWFAMKPEDVRLDKDHEVQGWLEYMTSVQRRAMYARPSMFTRAAKEGDHDFATFGGCVLSVELNASRSDLLYRCWHIRDVVWTEGEDGQLPFVARKWKAQAIELVNKYGHDKLDRKIVEAFNKAPFTEYDMYHIVCDAEMADIEAGRFAKVSILYDATHDKLISANGIPTKHYIIPRWQTVSGSQYPFSPATITALPDARLIQAMTYTLLEAGEKASNPPMIATIDAVRSDISIYAGGISWVDAQYDERMGSALRPIAQDYRGLPFGLDMLQDSRQILQQAFMLNKLRAFNPTSDPQMTAFQAGQLVQEYIRGALPLFEPMEMSYNGQLCEETFELMMVNNAFGPAHRMPQSLQGTDIVWHFESPLHDAIEAQKGQKFLEMKQLIAEAAELDPNATTLPDTVTALRDALAGIKVPADWTNNEVDAGKLQAQRKAAEENQALVEQMQTQAGAARDTAAASRDLAMAA